MPSAATRRLLLAAAVSVLVGPALADEILGDVIVVPQQAVPDAAEMKDLTAVYVRDSGVATEKLALAERMERLAEWDKSADVYQEIIDKYADRVIPTASDETGQIRQYTSVALVVQEKLSKWPEAGLSVYRDQYEDRAQELLAAAGRDRDLLQKVFTRYFVTESGKQAGLRLVSLGLERGEFAISGWVGGRLLSHHPLLLAERPMVLFKTALAEHLAGNSSAARNRLEELKQRFPNAAGTLRGQDVKLAEALADELAGQPSLARTFRSDAWPMAFGSLDAGAVPEQVSFGGARLFSIEIEKPDVRRNGASARQIEARFNEYRKSDGMTGILPAIDAGELFFQDNARVYAISLSSGLPLPGWQQRYPGDKRGAFGIEALPTPPGKLFGVSVNDNSVVALLGQIDPRTRLIMRAPPQPQPQLVSLDRQTGKLNWSVTMAGLNVPDDQQQLKEGYLHGIPLVVDDTIYCVIRASRGGQFEECHVVALRASTGAYLWSSYVASTAAGMSVDFDGDFLGSNEINAMLSYADGRLYVLTNMGAVACLDAADGKTNWLNIYPRNEASRRRMPMHMGMRVSQVNSQDVTKPFMQNPPMVVDGRVFVAPIDSPDVLVYDAASGQQQKRIPRELQRQQLSVDRGRDAFDAADMLLAVAGDEMVLGNRSTIFVIPWKTYDPDKSVMANNGKYREFQNVSAGSREKEAIKGRPLVASQHIFIPAADKLYRLGLDRSFKLQGDYPPQGTWDLAEEAPGNVVGTPDHLVIASSDRVTVYTDLRVATAKLDKLIEQDPTAAEPHLRYAELLLAGGSATDAIDWLDKAAQRMGGREHLQQGPLRDRLFEIACSFAIKLQRNESSSPELIRQLFARARDAADSAQQQVRYRLAHAQFRRGLGEAPGEIALHQEILAQPSWRAASVSGRAGASTAAAEAESAIAELVSQDPKLYAPYDEQAATRLAALNADAQRDPQKLIAIADEFPLSSSALPALQLAAGDFESAGNYRQATQTLRRVLRRGEKTELKVDALESLARNYTRLPHQLDLAIVRMEQAARLDPGRRLKRPLVVGQTKIEDRLLAEAAAMLRIERDATLRRSLPRLDLPSGKQSEKAFASTVTLPNVRAIIPQKTPQRPDRLVVLQRDSAVAQLNAGTVDQLFPPVRVGENPIGCAYSGDALIVVSAESAAMIDEGGKVAWTTQLSSLAPVERKTPAGQTTEPVDGEEQVMEEMIIRGGARLRLGANGVWVPVNEQLVAEQTGPERISDFRLLSDRVVISTTGGRVASLDLATGQIAWQARLADGGLSHFDAIDDFVVASSTDMQNDSELFVLNAIDGRVIQRREFSANRGQALSNLALSRDGVLVTTSTNTLSAVDLFDPEVRWERAAAPRGNPSAPFMMATGPDRLVITADHVLAVHAWADRQQQQVVRGYELRTGKPLLAGGDKGRNPPEAAFSPGGGAVQSPDDALRIATAGEAFYVYGQNTMAAFHLEKDWSWRPLSQEQWGALRELIVTQDFCLLINQPRSLNGTDGASLPALLLSTYSRSVLDNGAESGLLTHRPTFTERAGIRAGQWQATNGAFYYVTNNDTLKMLKPQ